MAAFPSPKTRLRSIYIPFGFLLWWLHATLPAATALQVDSSQKAVADSKTEASDGRPDLDLGARIYQKSCQSCHGETGQGSEDHYDRPLVGDLSVGNLTKLISQTMPENDADACVGEEAAAVAAYIHASFYGEAAQLRNRPPRVAMSRLTAEQLRQSIADLFGHFTKPPSTSDQRGVKAGYYNGTSRKSEARRIDRIDPVIDFDFGEKSPGGDIDPKNYLIEWEGSLKVDRSAATRLFYGAVAPAS